MQWVNSPPRVLQSIGRNTGAGAEEFAMDGGESKQARLIIPRSALLLVCVITLFFQLHMKLANWVTEPRIKLVNKAIHGTD
jgi:hypothetical protein